MPRSDGREQYFDLTGAAPIVEPPRLRDRLMSKTPTIEVPLESDGFSLTLEEEMGYTNNKYTFGFNVSASGAATPAAIQAFWLCVLAISIFKNSICWSRWRTDGWRMWSQKFHKYRVMRF
eukprot:TRINITY_DN34801_c0_g1_i1.p1 TRINITY_DN34801_c0_g1~~TRINITY_DN34801_c0_g1_i1.p1  ORF type:complete len:120 (-),score=15.27 TRINITY_DN34801_c0_g1_i1:448-807(-)